MTSFETIVVMIALAYLAMVLIPLIAAAPIFIVVGALGVSMGLTPQEGMVFAAVFVLSLAMPSKKKARRVSRRHRRKRAIFA